MADLNDLTTNVNIWNDEKTKAVTVTTDGSKERLDVNVNSGGGVALQRFTPVIDHSSSSVSLNTSTDTTLLTVTDDGKIDFIAIAASNSTYEVAIEVDSTEIYRMTMGDLGSVHGLANATNVPLWVETANKNFRLHANNEGIDFLTNFTVKAKATSGSPTVEWLVMYRTLA